MIYSGKVSCVKRTHTLSKKNDHQIFITGIKNIPSNERVQINQELRLVLTSAGWHFVKGIEISTT